MGYQKDVENLVKVIKNLLLICECILDKSFFEIENLDSQWKQIFHFSKF